VTAYQFYFSYSESIYNVSSNYAVCGCRLLLSNGVWQDASEVLGLMIFDM